VGSRAESQPKLNLFRPILPNKIGAISRHVVTCLTQGRFYCVESGNFRVTVTIESVADTEGAMPPRNSSSLWPLGGVFWRPRKSTVSIFGHMTVFQIKMMQSIEMWANAQRDGRPAECGALCSTPQSLADASCRAVK